MADLKIVDPATNPYLRGRFGPVDDEIEANGLTVDGHLPSDLRGTYVRNGPNPKFPPLGSYTFPMEGDGMLHGLWFEDGSARYKNRFVETEGLRAEERAGKALFGGLLSPAFVDQSLLGPDPDPGWPTKLDAFVNIVGHAGRWLALEEGLPAYEVTSELETVGRYDMHGELPKGLTAHPKIDPSTGELVLFRYDLEEPFLSWATVGADGHVSVPSTVVESVDRGYMIHDFAVTRKYLVVTIGPVVFDLDAMLSGGQALAWRPELGTRIAMIPRGGEGGTRWIETDAFWVWHFTNAYDDGDQIVMDFPIWDRCGFLDPDEPNSCGYVYAVLDPGRESIETHRVHEAVADFPRMDDRLTTGRHRYALLTASSGRPELVSAEHDVLCRVDVGSGKWVEYDTGGAVGEPVFAPRPGGTDELDGYYLAYVNRFEGGTHLGVWDAADFPGPPRASVQLPQRVPNGLHGSWFPSAT